MKDRKEKEESPNTNNQASSKSQMTNIKARWDLVVGIWKLFGVWKLVLGYSEPCLNHYPNATPSR